MHQAAASCSWDSRKTSRLGGRKARKAQSAAGPQSADGWNHLQQTFPCSHHSPSGRPASSTSSAACLEACRTATRPDSCTAGRSAAAAAAGSLLLAGRSTSVSAAALTTSAVFRRGWAAQCSCCRALRAGCGAICALQATGALEATATAAVRGMEPGLTARGRSASPQPSRRCRAGGAG